MKFLPGFSLLDKTFDDFFEDSLTFRKQGYMKTDVHEKDGNFILEMELPGYQKEDIQISLKDGYLMVAASSNKSNEEKDEKGNVVRKERYSGSCTRRFYVGDGVNEEDVEAKFENGELRIMVPQKEVKSIEEKRIKIQ